MRMGGIVMGKASEAVIQKATKIAGHVLETDPADVAFAEGRFTVKGTDRSIGLFEVARAARERNDLPEDLRGPLAAESDEFIRGAGFPFGCAVCEVEIDPDTGHVEIVRYTAIDDVGRAINPLILHGQTHGGIVQGVGQALWEHSHYDPESGQLLAGSMMDYAMPRAHMLPSFATELSETLAPGNPLGVRGGGEGGTTPALGVVVNAVVDALSDYGVTHIEMPVTAEKVWRAIRDGKSKGRVERRNGRERMADEILVKQDGPILRITLNAPDRGNAVTDDMVRELTKLINERARRSPTSWCCAAPARISASAAPAWARGPRSSRPPTRGGTSPTWCSTPMARCATARSRSSPWCRAARTASAAPSPRPATSRIASDKASFSVPEMAHQIMPTMVMSSFVDRVPRKAMAYLVYSMFEVSARARAVLRHRQRRGAGRAARRPRRQAHRRDAEGAAHLAAPAPRNTSAPRPDMPVAGAVRIRPQPARHHQLRRRNQESPAS